MKRILSLILFLLCTCILGVLLTSCGDDPGKDPGKDPGTDTYTVTWVVDTNTKNGRTETTETYSYHEVPTYKGKKKVANYVIACWDHTPLAIEKDETFTAVLCDEDMISADAYAAAYQTGLIHYTMATTSGQEDRQSKTEYWNPASALLTLAVCENYNELEGPARDRAVAQVRSLINGNEPMFDACCYWVYATLAAACTAVRHTETIWSALTTGEQERLDWIMKCFAVLVSFSSADYNNYTCGPGRNGNFGKGWNPNYQFANITPIVSAVAYFSPVDEQTGELDTEAGAKAVNDTLFNFDYDEYMDKFDEFGWNNVKYVWGASSAKNNGNNLMMQGGATTYRAGALAGTPGAYAGTGVGVIPPTKDGFVWKSYTLDEATKIYNEQVVFMFSGGTIANNHPTDTQIGILKNGEYNPALGLLGMMTEFYSSDGGGVRSSTTYCEHDFNMVVGVTLVYDTIGFYTMEDNPDAITLMKNGCDDLLFKLEQGYNCKSNGSYYVSSKGGMGGMAFYESIWYKMFSDRVPEVEIPD